MPFGSLWLPVVVSAVVVWLLSAVLHMVLKYHRADYKKLPDEDAVAAALGRDAPPPGVYVLPYIMDPARMKEPAVRERYERGPIAHVLVQRNRTPEMGKFLGVWFLFCLLVSFATAYVARHTLGYDTDGLTILRITGTVAFIGYGFGVFPSSIWGGIPWANSLRALVDAALYGLATGLAFMYLWPAA